METLKKEQIMPYLPFELRLLTNYKTDIEIMTTSNIGVVCNHVDKERLIPILHPLSDLAKKIEHKGQKGGDIFLPARILMCPQFKFCDDREDLLFDLQSPESIQRCPYNVVQKLLEWKFDIFGLPSHLWIDVNTLEVNPYK